MKKNLITESHHYKIENSMYVKLNCLITITTKSGKLIKFSSLNDIVIEKSIDKLYTTCKLKVPTSARLNTAAGNSNVKTSSVFEKGDRVNVQLGYNDRLNEEFEGFIDKINMTTPLEIECEGYEFHLRDSLVSKTFASTNLKEVLQYIVKGVPQIMVNTKDVPEIQMKNYIIPANLKRIDALQQLKDNYGLTIFFIKDELYAGLDFVKYLGNVKYSLGVNTPSVDELKFQKAEDIKLRIKAIQINKDNTKLDAETGDSSGELRTLYFHTAKSKADLIKLAQAEILKYKFDGFSGKLTSKLEPWSAPGMVAKIVDKQYPERAGNYEIRSVTTSFGTSGAKRTVEIGKVVSV